MIPFDVRLLSLLMICWVSYPACNCIDSLLQDHETEVRAATIKDISAFVDLVGPATFATEVMPYVLALLQDVNLVRLLYFRRTVYPSMTTLAKCDQPPAIASVHCISGLALFSLTRGHVFGGATCFLGRTFELRCRTLA